MEHPVTASYRWTVDELMTALEYHSRFTVKRSRQITVTLIGVVAALALVWAALEGQPTAPGILPYYLIALLALGYFVVPKWLAKQQFERRPDRDRLLQFQIDSRGITSRIDGLAEGLQRWPGLVRVIRTPKGFMFYPDDQTYFWVPEHAFTFDDDVQQVEQLVRRYAPSYIDAT